jgi:hypothetical protein
MIGNDGGCVSDVGKSENAKFFRPQVKPATLIKSDKSFILTRRQLFIYGSTIPHGVELIEELSQKSFRIKIKS